MRANFEHNLELQHQKSGLHKHLHSRIRDNFHKTQVKQHGVEAQRTALMRYFQSRDFSAMAAQRDACHTTQQTPSHKTEELRKLLTVHQEQLSRAGNHHHHSGDHDDCSHRASRYKQKRAGAHYAFAKSFKQLADKDFDSNVQELHVEKSFREVLHDQHCELKHKRQQRKHKYARKVTMDTFEKLYQLYNTEVGDDCDE